MSTLEKITISLPSEMVSEIKEAIEAGEFTSTSEAVRDALRRWRNARKVIVLSDDELRRLVEESRADGRTVDGKSALLRLREKYQGMASSKKR